MIQILGLRDNPNNPDIPTEVFFEKGWRLTSIDDVFTKYESILSRIPSSEHYNLYFTVADCFEERGRKLKEQWAIQFDIDHIGTPEDSQEQMEEKAEAVARASCEALGILYEDTGVIFTGNGVQFFIRTQKPIVDPLEFKMNSQYYHKLAKDIGAKLAQRDLVGKVDTSVFSHARIMRFPATENRKKGKPVRIAKVLQGNLKPIDFNIKDRSGLEELMKHDQIAPEQLKKYPQPDTKAVMEGCSFIKKGFTNAAELDEPEWYAWLSVVGRLANGGALVHSGSKGHPGYNYHEAQSKLEQALEVAGPRTCKDISKYHEGCKACPYNGKIKSPILIFGEDYIRTKDHGFRDMKPPTAEGLILPGKPNYSDLIKFFSQTFSYVIFEDTEAVCIFNGTHWQEMSEARLREWVMSLVVPIISVAEMSEFIGRLKARNVRERNWSIDSIKGKMNFKNGVLDLRTMELESHSPEYGFMHVLPYAYNRQATAPLWDAFLKEICCGDESLINLLEEFGGYAIYGGECLAAKALILLGEGRNGKSVYAETIGQVVGTANHSTLMLHNLKNEQLRYGLVNKLFNFSDESSFHALQDSADFKTLVTGGSVQVKKVFEVPFPYRNIAKFIILANDLPDNKDTSEGMFRRLLITKFNRQFTDADDNRNLKYLMWSQELPGICNRLISAFKRLEERNYNFIEPESSKVEITEYRESSNPVLQFVKDSYTTTESSDDFVPIVEIYKDYETWCNLSNERAVPIRRFSSSLKRLYPKSDHHVRRRVGGVPVRSIVKFKKIDQTQGEF